MDETKIQSKIIEIDRAYLQYLYDEIERLNKEICYLKSVEDNHDVGKMYNYER